MMAIAADSRPDVVPVRRPGDFARHPHNGAPFVADPERTSKPKGTKAELIAQCAERGIEVPAKVAVAQLHELLGPRPSMVMYGRPSSLGKIIEDATNLQKWAERAVALGVFLDLCEAERASTDGALLDRLGLLTEGQLNLDDPDARVVLDEVATLAKNVARTGLAADRGTHTHALTEDNDEDRDWLARASAGEDLGIDPAAQAALVAAWNLMLAESGLEILATEAAVVDDRWRQAGTLDRIARATRELRFTIAGGEIVTIPAGWVGVLDIKTGRLRVGNDAHPDYWHGYAVQLACYAQARPYDVDTDTRGEWPFEIDQRWAIIAHLDVLSALDGNAACRLVLVDLEAGRQAGDLCIAAKGWGRRRDVFSLVTGDAWVVPVVIAAQPQPAQQAEEGGVAPAPSAGSEAAAVPARPLAAAASPSEGPGVTATPAPSAAAAGGVSAPPPAAAPSDDEQRVALRERLAAMRQSASDTGRRPAFEAELATKGLTKSSTVAEIKAALDEIEPPFDPAPAELQPAPYADAQVAAAEPERWATEADVEQVRQAIAGSSLRAVVNAWVAEGQRGDHPWSPLAVRSERNVAIAWAALRLSEYVDTTDGDEYVRLLLGHVVGPSARQATVPVGVVLGALTLAEARQVHALAGAFADGITPLQFDTEGRPFLGGDVAAVLAAA